MKKIFSFFFSKFFVLNLGIYLVVLLIGFFIFKSWLSSYTDHNQKLEVPSFINLDFEAATILAKANNLQLRIIDTVYSTDIKPGNIVDHTPRNGEFVKEYRTIYISINSLTPIMVVMPKITDVSLRQAMQVLERYGLQLGEIEYKPDFADNYVLEQKYHKRTIGVGTKLPKGSKIDLVVGKGEGGEPVVVPNFVGLTYADVLQNAASVGLSINPLFGTDSYQTSADSLKTVVWKQNPRADNNTKVFSGSTVDVWLMNPESVTNF